MVTGELRSKIDSLWEIFWTGGLTNPLDVIEQMTYLMFIHDLDDADNTRAKEAAMLGLPYQSIFAKEVKIGERTVDGSQLKWSVFHDFPAGRMYSTVQEWVFPFIKELHGDKESAYSKYMGDAIFKIPTPLMLDKIVTAMDGIYDQMAQLKAADTRGDVYEYLLSKIATAGVNGQFRTPRHIIRMMVDLMQPKADEIVCDPACGTSGFLVAVSDYLKENRKQEVFFNRQNKDHYMNHMFHGYDMDRTMLRIGAMNMMTHGVDNPFIEYRDSLSDQNPDRDKYSLILANPPFKGSLDADIVSTDLLKVCKTKKTELLFLALFLRMLKVGGRCACIVPDGVLFGSSTAHKAIRKELIENNRLEAVISMPSGVFKPYAGVSTAILIFTKTGHGGTDKVWFYDMKADGFSLDDKRSETKENDIPDIIARFCSLKSLPPEGKVSAQSTDEVSSCHCEASAYTGCGNPFPYDESARARTEQSFFVPKDEIVSNDSDLSINKYKQTEYKPVEYPPTSEIMARLRRIEDDIDKKLSALGGMIDGENSIEKYDYKQLFRHACSFSDCADFAMKEFDPRIVDVEWYTTPATVNSAFACEVYLKALLLYYEIPSKKQHELKELYDMLPDKTKEWIMLTVTNNYGKWKDSSGFDLLDGISNAFVEWRYNYEYVPQKTCSLQNNTSFLTVFRNTLREACCNLFFGKTWEEYLQ